MILTQNI